MYYKLAATPVCIFKLRFSVSELLKGITLIFTAMKLEKAFLSDQIPRKILKFIFRLIQFTCIPLIHDLSRFRSPCS